MREECTAALQTLRMPTTRNEEYRFTDVTPILQTVPRVRATQNCSLLFRLGARAACKGAGTMLLPVPNP